MLRLIRSIGIAALVAIVSTLAVSWLWSAIGGGQMSVHGWIALSLGVAGTVGLAWLLMALAFKSNREGWDDRVDNTLDPGRDEPGDRRRP